MLHNQTHKIVHSAMYYQNLIIIHECSKELLKIDFFFFFYTYIIHVHVVLTMLHVLTQTIVYIIPLIAGTGLIHHSGSSGASHGGLGGRGQCYGVVTCTLPKNLPYGHLYFPQDYGSGGAGSQGGIGMLQIQNPFNPLLASFDL